MCQCEATQWWSAESRVEQMGVAYALRPTPGTEASATTTRKRKADASKKTIGKKAKVVPTKKADIVKIIRPKPRSGMKGPSKRELVLVKPLGVTKKFSILGPSVPALG
jgi:hypothetical protein